MIIQRESHTSQPGEDSGKFVDRLYSRVKVTVGVSPYAADEGHHGPARRKPLFRLHPRVSLLRLCHWYIPSPIVTHGLAPQFDKFPTMKFDSEPCNWGMLARNEVLTPFAPRSAWIWKPRQGSKRNGEQLGEGRLGLTKELINDANRLDKIIGGTVLRRRMLRNFKEEINRSKKISSESVVPAKERKSRPRIVICEGSQMARPRKSSEPPFPLPPLLDIATDFAARLRCRSSQRLG